MENISVKADRYTYAVCVASLLHDCGKPLLDLNVVYGSPKQYKTWVPWTGHIPVNNDYAFRYRPDRKHGQHELGGSSLLPVIVPDLGLSWLYEDKELTVYLLAQLTGKEAQASAIGEIVRAADKESVSKALKGNSSLQQYKDPEPQKTSLSIHEQLLMAIRYLFSEGLLKLNKPGAAGWIADGRAWLVSKAVVEAAVEHLSSEGITGIPKNIARVFDILLENGLVMASEEDKSVWKCKIYDQDRDWHQELTMLCFDQDVVFPNEKPQKFHGTVTPVIKKQEKEDPLDDKEAVLKKLSGNPDQQTEPKGDSPFEIKKYAGKSVNKKKQDASKKPCPSKNTIGTQFVDWVANGIESKAIIVNDKNAHVHAVDGKVLLVSPAIFKRYLKECPAAIITLAGTAGNKNDVQKLQHYFQRLALHEKINGSNMRKFEVAGDRNTSRTLQGYLITDKKKILKDNNFTNNRGCNLICVNACR